MSDEETKKTTKIVIGKNKDTDKEPNTGNDAPEASSTGTSDVLEQTTEGQTTETSTASEPSKETPPEENVDKDKEPPPAIKEMPVDKPKPVNIFESMVLDYMEKMAGQGGTNPQTAIGYQYSLLNIYKQVLMGTNIQSFKDNWSVLVKLFKEHHQDGLSMNVVGRHVSSHWTRSAGELELFNKISDLLRQSAKLPIKEIPEHFAFDKLPGTIDSDVQQELIKFYT